MTQTASPEKAAERTPSGLWLNGAVLSCACPECGGPMAIRAWLMLGDCYRCGVSIELTEAQELEAERLLADAESETAIATTRQSPIPSARTPSAGRTTLAPPTRLPAASVQAAAASALAPAPRPSQRPPSQRATGLPRELPPVASPPGKAPAALRPIGAQVRTYRLARLGAARVWLQDLLSDMPAWLASLLFHMIFLLLLALLVAEHDEQGPSIVLSATIGPKHRQGERASKDPNVDQVEFEDPGVPKDPVKAKAEAAAISDATELHVPRDTPSPNLPKLASVIEKLNAPDAPRMFEGRDPRIRASVVDAEGGTTYTEAAVARGLRWLSKHQHADGRWGLHNFQDTPECHGQCGGHGDQSDVGGTALALLPFFGAGQTHLSGRYTKEVGKALDWLIAEQRTNGDLRGEGVGRMYAHGQATIVLCEAYATTGDEKLREPAEKAMRYIVDAQHSEGGWRYNPGEAGDTSVVGWQLMALRSAKMALLDVPDDCFAKAANYLDRAQADELGRVYGYQPGQQPTPQMTAEALLCREYLGWPQDHPGLEGGVRVLLRDHLPQRDQPSIYYWYYGTQVLHHLGGPAWQEWNTAMRNALVPLQETEGHQAGSWSPRGGPQEGHFSQVGGRIYWTSLAICTLEVYYRHLPIYRKLNLDE